MTISSLSKRLTNYENRQILGVVTNIKTSAPLRRRRGARAWQGRVRPLCTSGITFVLQPVESSLASDWETQCSEAGNKYFLLKAIELTFLLAQNSYWVLGSQSLCHPHQLHTGQFVWIIWRVILSTLVCSTTILFLHQCFSLPINTKIHLPRHLLWVAWVMVTGVRYSFVCISCSSCIKCVLFLFPGMRSTCSMKKSALMRCASLSLTSSDKEDLWPAIGKGTELSAVSNRRESAIPSGC